MKAVDGRGRLRYVRRFVSRSEQRDPRDSDTRRRAKGVSHGEIDTGVCRARVGRGHPGRCVGEDWVTGAASTVDDADAGAPDPLAARTRERVYIPALDGVRFLAFALVFFSHFGGGGAFAALWPALGRTLATIAAFGWMGVDIFLCLSGFLLATLLLHEIAATGAVSIRWFYVRRVLRIWPLYYLMLAIGFGIAPFLLGQTGSAAYQKLLARHLFPFATLFGNFSYAYFVGDLVAMDPSAEFFAPLWTIALEEQFYLLFPLLMAAAPYISTRAAVWCAVGVVIFSSATRLYIVGNGIPYPMVWTNTFARLDPIVLGIAGAIVWHRHREALGRVKLSGAEIVGAIAAFWLVVSFPQIGQSWHTVWQLCATAIGSLLLILSAMRYRGVGAAFGWRPIAWLGKISYGLYVFHNLAIWLYRTKVAPHVPIVSQPLRGLTDTALVLGVTIGLAAASYYLYERRFLQLKERFALVASRAI
jgi:peptidoglycan/LPS O-acetylase OafA/YrhL